MPCCRAAKSASSGLLTPPLAFFIRHYFIFPAVAWGHWVSSQLVISILKTKAHDQDQLSFIAQDESRARYEQGKAS